jgi:DNA topoisomerase-1
VTAFLLNYFRKYVEYDFTADAGGGARRRLGGRRDYKDVLERFWRDFSAAIDETSELRITEVLEKINEVLEPHLFPPNEDGTDPRSAPTAARAAVDAHRALRRRLHRLLELPRMPLHPPLRPAGQRARSPKRSRNRRAPPCPRAGRARHRSRKGADAPEPAARGGPHPEDGEMVEAGIGRYGPFVKHGRASTPTCPRSTRSSPSA